MRQGRKEEARQRGRRRKGRKEEARQGGGRKRGSALQTTRGIRAVEFHPDFKTVQVWWKIQRTFRWSQNLRIRIILTTRLVLVHYTDGREGVLEEAGEK